MLFRTRARLRAEEAPPGGQDVELTLALPGRRSAQLSGRVTWSMITTAPALLCGDVDRSLGAHFELEFRPECPDLVHLNRLFENRARQRGARVRRIARRAGIAPWLPA